MTQHDERYLDPFAQLGDPTVAQARADLVRAYMTTPPRHLREAMDRAVRERMTALRRATPAIRRAPFPTWERRPAMTRKRLVSLVAALLLAVSGAGGYLRLTSPTPVSAQIVLRRAAGLQLAPHQAAHLSYSVVVTDGNVAANSGQDSSKASAPRTLTADVWIQADASGGPTLSAQTLTMSGQGGADVWGRYVQVGRQAYAYDVGHNAILLSPEERGTPSWVLPNDAYDGAGVAQSLAAFAQGSPQRVQLRPQQSLDGHTVDVIEVDGWTDRPGQRTLFYFDAQSYLLRGFDASSLDPSYPTPSWQVRLIGYGTVDAAAVPSGTFALNAPATARVVPPALTGPTLAAAVEATCHSNLDGKDVLKAGKHSLLAACQATAPGVTAADLIDALAAPGKAAITAAAAAGVISPAQAADGLAALQAQLNTLVTMPGGQGA